MSETRGCLNVKQPSEHDLENGILREESDETAFRVHMRGGYDGGGYQSESAKRDGKTQEEIIESQRVLAAPFEKRIQEVYGPSVVYSENGASTVNLASLHRYILHSMQKELVLDAFDFTYGEPGQGRQDLGCRLHGYKLALEDWDYIKQSALKGMMNDPFIVTTEKELDRVLLTEMAQKWGEAQRFDTNPTIEQRVANLTAIIDGAAGYQRHEPRDKDRWKMLKAPRHIGNKKEAFELFMHRLRMAAIGGAFLVGPMLVMVLQRSVLTSLLTASLCVVAFGLTLAIYLEKPFEVLSGTAAYAAVLMVFVGNSGG